MLNQRDLTRREILKAAAAGTLSPALAARPELERITPPVSEPDRIRAENDHPGTRDWMATNVRVDPKSRYRCPWIEGFVSRTSVKPGESVAIHVSTNPPCPFLIEIYRMGYYRGDGARLMQKIGPVKGGVQPDPPIGPKRLRECVWEPNATLEIPADWTSGVYLGKLTAEREKLQSYVVFVVRDDRKADFLFQVSDTTWNAYNRWPSQFALYDDGKKEWYWGPGVQTSFDRPYGKYCQVVDAPLSVGSGEYLLWEYPLAYWMEQQGYDVSYISNLDTHADLAGLRRAKGWLSVGHDEYWSLAMFEQVRRMVGEGLNVAFLSGNSICGVVDIRPASDGRPNRIIERVGRFGSPRKEEIEKGYPEEALFTQNGPNEATLIGAEHVSGNRRRRLDLPQARPLAFRRHRHEGRRGHSGASRLGVARRPRSDRGTGGDRQRQDAMSTCRWLLYRDNLPRPEREFCLQRVDDLVGRRGRGATRLRPSRCVYPPPGARSPGPADHAKLARADARVVTCQVSLDRGRRVPPRPGGPGLDPASAGHVSSGDDWQVWSRIRAGWIGPCRAIPRTTPRRVRPLIKPSPSHALPTRPLDPLDHRALSARDHRRLGGRRLPALCALARRIGAGPGASRGRRRGFSGPPATGSWRSPASAPGRDEVDYLIGVCEAAQGDSVAAIGTWGRIPPRSRYAARAAVRRVRLALPLGHFAAAEDLAAAFDDPQFAAEARQTCAFILKVEGRAAEARRVFEDGWRYMPSAVASLREIWRLDHQPLDVELSRDELTRAGAKVPDDDRVWLGRANLAIWEGRFDEAARWLDQCLHRRAADPAVWRAWLFRARPPMTPLALWRALEHLTTADLEATELPAIRAWLASRSGRPDLERPALEERVKLRPEDLASYDRLAALCAGTPDAPPLAECARRGGSRRRPHQRAVIRRRPRRPRGRARPQERRTRPPVRRPLLVDASRPGTPRQCGGSRGAGPARRPGTRPRHAATHAGRAVRGVQAGRCRAVRGSAFRPLRRAAPVPR